MTSKNVSAWDGAEDRLYPVNFEIWTSVDKSIDRALKQLRSSAPVAVECSKDLKGLTSKMESMQAGPKHARIVRAVYRRLHSIRRSRQFFLAFPVFSIVLAKVSDLLLATR